MLLHFILAKLEIWRIQRKCGIGKRFRVMFQDTLDYFNSKYYEVNRIPSTINTYEISKY